MNVTICITYEVPNHNFSLIYARVVDLYDETVRILKQNDTDVSWTEGVYGCDTNSYSHVLFSAHITHQFCVKNCIGSIFVPHKRYTAYILL
jgi:hypothetical protein